jgi:ABC-type amino acid transport substrate-binding protein
MVKWRLLIAGMMMLGLFFGCAGMQPSPNPVGDPIPALDRILSSGELRVGMSGDMPPLTMVDKEGKLDGLDADLAAAIAKTMNVKPNLQRIDFAELLPALEAGRIDLIISNMTMTPERNLKAFFIGPYLTSGKGLLTRRSTLAEVVQMHELNSSQFTFVTVKGTTSESVVRSGAPLAINLAAESIDQAVQAVLDGTADAMIADYPVCFVAAFRYRDAGLVPVKAPITYEPIGIAMPKGDPHLANWIENLLHGLQQAGYMKKLKDRWFDHPDWLDELK